jgi:hypothetical protein
MANESGNLIELSRRTDENKSSRFIAQRDDWKTPIIVNLQPQQANVPEIPPADLRFSQTGFGIKLQLDLTNLRKRRCVTSRTGTAPRRFCSK